jgi:6-phosphogluconolactonase
VTLAVEILADADDVAARAAEEVASLAGERVAAPLGERTFTFAVSGGRTPWTMFEAMAQVDVPWDAVRLFQVDERVAPPGDPARNLTHLLEALPPGRASQVHAMPVNDDDLERAAAGYARELPERFDLIHLGLGTDGHTASLVPDDPVLDVRDRDVAVTEPYQGHRRMTLTYPVLDRSVTVLWLVTGAEKAEAVRRLREHDRSIPAGRVAAHDQRLICDRAAAGR